MIVTPKDIFPDDQHPGGHVIWQYTGLTPQDMEQRITTYREYSISDNVNDIRDIPAPLSKSATALLLSVGGG